MATIDWTGCNLVETDPEKVSGTPVVKPTRVPADAIVEDYNLGSDMEELRENYPSVSEATIEGLLQYARTHIAQPQP